MTLHEQIQEALDHNPNGWCSNGKAAHLASLVLAMGGGNVLEIGVYAGRSFIPMAMAVKHCGRGMAYGIDPFTVAAAVENEQLQHKEWWERMPFERIEEILRENIMENELVDWVSIIKNKSSQVGPINDLSVFHCDGNHAQTAIGDVAKFAPHVVIGGFAVLDDVAWDSGCVSASIHILTDLGFVERSRVVGPEKRTNFTDDYAVFQRVGFCK